MTAHGFSSPFAGRHRTLRRTGLVLCGFLVCTWLQVPAAPKKKKAEQESEKKESVSIKLKADVQGGFTPLPITFTGRIKNLDIDDDRFCHAGTFLLREMVTGQFETVAGEDPACLHDPEKREINPTFSIRYVIQNAGSYEFFAMVATKDGRRIRSNGVPVRAIPGVGR